MASFHYARLALRLACEREGEKEEEERATSTQLKTQEGGAGM